MEDKALEVREESERDEGHHDGDHISDDDLGGDDEAHAGVQLRWISTPDPNGCEPMEGLSSRFCFGTKRWSGWPVLLLRIPTV
ncbi:MAG: hypothetical protein H0T69_03935 [Thermoleophilaceae bacterium]|nr:hypothetical protein [Thermoleophilaceae bacterium]